MFLYKNECSGKLVTYLRSSVQNRDVYSISCIFCISFSNTELTWHHILKFGIKPGGGIRALCPHGIFKCSCYYRTPAVLLFPTIVAPKHFILSTWLLEICERQKLKLWNKTHENLVPQPEKIDRQARNKCR